MKGFSGSETDRGVPPRSSARPAGAPAPVADHGGARNRYYVPGKLSTFALGVFLSGCSDSADVSKTSTEPAAVRAPVSSRARLPAVTSRGWARLRTANADQEYDQYPVYRGEKFDYWFSLLLNAHKALWDFLKSDAADDAALRALFGQFGREGAQADFRLLFADPYLMQPWPFTAQHGPKGSGLNGRELQLLRSRVCSAEVAILCKDMDRLRRYYHAVLWSGVWLRANQSHRLVRAAVQTKNGFDSAPKADQMCYLRDFLVLAAATGRLDLLEDRNSSDLKSAWAAWWKWYSESSKVFRFDKKTLSWRPVNRILAPLVEDSEDEGVTSVPNAPFGDWRGVQPYSRPMSLVSTVVNALYEETE